MTKSKQIYPIYVNLTYLILANYSISIECHFNSDEILEKEKGRRTCERFPARLLEMHYSRGKCVRGSLALPRCLYSLAHTVSITPSLPLSLTLYLSLSFSLSISVFLSLFLFLFFSFLLCTFGDSWLR